MIIKLIKLYDGIITFECDGIEITSHADPISMLATAVKKLEISSMDKTLELQSKIDKIVRSDQMKQIIFEYLLSNDLIQSKQEIIKSIRMMCNENL